MFTPLPAHTVFEARKKTQFNTVVLFSMLSVLYFCFVQALSLLIWGLFSWRRGFHFHEGLFLYSSLLSVFVAALHFFTAYWQPMDKLTKLLNAYPADPSDEVHKVFIHIIREAEAASGIRLIRPLIIPDPALNAFSLMDRYGNCAIGVTEGLLNKLNRHELSAVVAHETSHLIHQDARLIAIACCLFGVFDAVHKFFFPDSFGKRKKGGWLRIFKIRAPHAILVLLLMMAIIKFSHLAARLMNMAISRNREYLADASAVHLCKDPAALASALHKIAFSARNFLSTENNVASMFIVHPCLNALDEDSGLVSDLFSTHPPMHKRLEKLLTWAKTSLSQLKVTKPAPSNVSKDAYFRWGSGQWLGPLNAEDLLADSHLSVNDWIAGPMGILKAVDYAFLKDKFQGNLVSQAKEAGVLETASPYSCPRCKLNLYEVRYEGLKVYHCLMCKGYLLAKNYLSRLVVRDLRVFTPQETKEARIWRMTRGRQIGELCVLEAINCPFCKDMMSKIIYSETSKVVIDRCQNASCASVWCDAGELEKVQILSHSEDESFTRN